MAAAPAALTIRSNFPRPTAAQLAGFRGMPTGWVVDAQGREGALSHEIRCVTKASAFVGTALTVHTRSRDNLAPWAALDLAKPGDVLVVATDAYLYASTIGDLMAGMAKNCGVVAIVTDGLVRDVPGLDEVGLPVFARGVSPNSPFKDGPGAIGLTVSLAGMTVDSGDILVGDGDGVVVVKRAEADAVLAALQEVKAKEAKMEKAVKAGAKRPDWLDKALADKGVRLVD
ncbi:MAG: RraA family protein [Alphaproteobacteria bacterium]|nr:RraA family protein [Alphaproteobacteria bacterium]